MIRKTLTIFSLIGLLLSVAAWGVSYFDIWYFAASAKYNVALQHGGIMYAHRWQVEDDGSKGLWRVNGYRGLGTMWIPRTNYPNQPPEISFLLTSPNRVIINLPLWIPTTLFGAALWAAYAPTHRRRKRKKLGLCLKCGYDLRASKDRCPECGSTI